MANLAFALEEHDESGNLLVTYVQSESRASSSTRLDLIVSSYCQNTFDYDCLTSIKPTPASEGRKINMAEILGCLLTRRIPGERD
jgi:hypothetical protein